MISCFSLSSGILDSRLIASRSLRLLNILWLSFFLVTLISAVAHAVFHQDGLIFEQVVAAWFNAAKTSVDISLGLIGLMSLWLGLFKVAEHGGLVRQLGRLLAPLMSRLMPDIPKDHPAHGAMTMNIAANVLGLDNAATPLGLKAMRELQTLNTDPTRATRAQGLFLVINASSVTLIPVSIFMFRAQQGAADPASVFLPILMATTMSTVVGVTAYCLTQGIKLFDRVVMLYGASFALMMALLITGLSSVSASELSAASSLTGNAILVAVICLFLGVGAVKRNPVYDQFIEGAKEGFKTAIDIIPYLIAMLVAIAGLRASHALDMLLDGIAYVLQLLQLSTEFVPALTTALMKPLSGSGARAMMLETMQVYGVDSFPALVAATVQGSSETTFYVIAVYYGVVGIRRDRGALGCGLLADLAGVTTAIVACYWFFPPH